MLLPQCDGLRQVAETAGFDLEVSAERAAATGLPAFCRKFPLEQMVNVEEAEMYIILNDTENWIV